MVEHERVLAVSKVFKDTVLKAARKGVETGTHEVDCLVHVTGTITVGADGKANATGASINYKAAFATAIGLLRHELEKRCVGFDLEALLGVCWGQGETAVELAAPLVETIARREAIFTKSTGTVPTKGRVTTKLAASFVD